MHQILAAGKKRTRKVQVSVAMQERVNQNCRVRFDNKIGDVAVNKKFQKPKKLVETFTLWLHWMPKKPIGKEAKNYSRELTHKPGMSRRSSNVIKN